VAHGHGLLDFGGNLVCITFWLWCGLWLRLMFHATPGRTVLLAGLGYG